MVGAVENSLTNPKTNTNSIVGNKMKLATWDEVSPHCKECTFDEKEWRQLVWRILTYATSTDTTNNPNEEEKKDDLSIRTEKARDLLIQLFQHDNDNSSSGKSKVYPGWMMVLVDGMWLMGCMYEGGKSSSATSSKIQSYKALCTLIHGLAYHHQSNPYQVLFLERLQLSLEPSTLASAGILSGNNAEPMIKRKLKINTDLHYRQTKFNLLQEESQGYAKLLTFLTLLTTTHTEEDNENEDSKSTKCTSKVQINHQHYKALMGTFDLDPNRVLDLTLDVVESQILHKLPLEQPKNDRNYLDNIVQKLLYQATMIPNLLQLIQVQYPKHHKKVIPHLLGFKLTSCFKKNNNNNNNNNTDNNNDEQEQLSLFVLTAILAMHQMCSIQDLQPHLLQEKSSKQSSMLHQEIQTPYTKLYKQTVQTLKKMGNVSLNSSNANANTAESESTEEQTQRKKAPPIITLLHVFLQLKCDWNTMILPLFHHDLICIQKAAFLYPDTIGNAICHYISTHLLPVTNPGQDLLLPSKRNQKNNNYDATMTDPTIVITEEDLLGPLRAIIPSGSVASHPILYCQLCRYLSSRIDTVINDDNGNISNSLYALLSEFLVPSLSLFPNNPNISSELWNHVLCKLPYSVRYSLYQAAWKQGGLEKGALRGMKINKALPNIESEIQTGISTRYLLKRMSKDNIRDMGRQISKVSHNNPVVIFSLILNQIESYDNLILLMVETFKFVSVLSLDVMGFSLLSSLSFSNKSKVKEDGVNAAQWLSSLETFCGAFYKKFPYVEMRGIICYIMKRLLDGHILELGILRTLLRMAGGYAYADSSSAFLSQVQLDGRCGSKLLKRETSDFGIVEKVNIKSAKQLRKTLQANSDGVTILILLSQLRNKIIYGEQEHRHIKLIGNLYDCSQRVLDLLVGFLTETDGDESKDKGSECDSSITKYAASLPPLGELRNDYGLENVMSWMLCRPLIRAAMFSHDNKKETTLPLYLKPFDPMSKEMKETYPLMLPEKAWKFITTDLFQMFYSLDISDILFPEERYTQEISRLKKEVDRLSELQKGGGGSIATKASLAAAAAAAGGSVREIRDATVFSKTHEQELDRVKRHSEILLSDMETQKSHVASVKEKLVAVKESFWITNDPYRGSHCEDFFTHCVYPRCLVSTEDALFCAHFVNILHDMATPGFYTLDYFNTATDALIGALYCVTEDEARNLGLMMEQMWKVLSSWRYDENNYNTSVGGKPGAVYMKEESPADDSSTSENPGRELSYEDFGSVYNGWHDSLGYAFIGCLKSSEYMHTRAALIILTRIVNVYPTRSVFGENFLNALAPLKGDENHMQDIKAMAQAYYSQLIKSRDDGIWQDEDDATAKARIEKERRLQEARRKNAEKQHEEMKKDVEKITQQIGDSRTRGWDERNNRNRGNDSNRATHSDQGGRRQQPTGTAASITSKFTPANGGPSIHLQRTQNQRPIVPGRGGGPADPREYPRGVNEVRRSRDREPHHTHNDMRGERYTSVEVSQQSQQVDRRGSDERERDSKVGRDMSPANDLRGRGIQTSTAERSLNVETRRRPPSNENMPYKRGRSPERGTRALADNVRGVVDDRDPKRQRMQAGNDRGNGSAPKVPHVVAGGNATGRSRQMHVQYNSSSQHGDRGNDRNNRRTDRRSKRYDN